MSLINLPVKKMIALTHAKHVAFFALLFFLFLKVQAQGCRTDIRNNTIEVLPAVCVGSVAYLKGSTPAGGSGIFFYQWEMADRNCGENSFKPIAGATGKDYMLPANANPEACNRRVVVSGT